MADVAAQAAPTVMRPDNVAKLRLAPTASAGLALSTWPTDSKTLTSRARPTSTGTE